MTRVLFASSRYPPTIAGGGEVSLQLLAESLAKRGHSVKVASCDDGPGEVNGIAVERLRLSTGAAAPGEAFRRVLSLARDFELIHAYNLEFFGFSPGLFDLMATRKKALGRPVVAHLNHPSIYFKSLAVKNLIKRIYRRIEAGVCLRRLAAFDAFIALSGHLKARYVGQGLSNDKIRVIPNLLPEEYFTPPAPFPLPPVILYVGNLGAHKGVSDLIEAFAAAHARFPQARLRLLGWASLQELSGLSALVQKLDVSDWVSIDPPVPHDQLVRAYDAAAIVVHPGRWKEPFGRAVIEGMARGRPVVVSRAGEPPNLVGNPELVFKPGDVDALEAKLERLLGHPDEAERTGKKLRERASRFSIREVLPQIEQVYKFVLKKA